jgi:hypothetical protein
MKKDDKKQDTKMAERNRAKRSRGRDINRDDGCRRGVQM